MYNIFISYRRDDSADIAGRIFDCLTQPFGPFLQTEVFMDVHGIPPGVNFKKYLEDRVQQCAVCLVIIGPRWADMTDANGKRRLDNPADYVRIEVETALKRNIPVIPLLVMGNLYVPGEDQLPASLAELPYMNGLPVRRDPDFRPDIDKLTKYLQEMLQTVRQSGTSTSTTTPPPPAPIAKPTRKRSIDLLPAPFAWIEIPGKGYSIAKYPLTNAQFRLFVDAGGYQEKRWWTEAGWAQCEKEKWTEPRYWTDANWNGPEYPVVGVSWYESVAYCLWLSDVTGEKIMLPTEDQWQYAAQGDDGRDYPWGKQWNANRCNNNVGLKGIGKTTPVRQYEGSGDSPFGVVDMAGNVWEWCLTDDKTKMNDVNNNAKIRVLRGGSWVYGDTDYFRCDYHDGNYPGHGNVGIGFRCARSS